MADIFISYKREDREHARAMAEMFIRHGYDVWWDVDLLPGEKFADAINSVIESAKAVVVLWTPRSIRSDWVKSETALALQRGILVPVWLEKTDLPVPYNTIHTLDLSDWSGDVNDDALSPLLEAVRRVAGDAVIADEAPTKSEIVRKLQQPAYEAEFWVTVSSKQPQSIEEYEAYLTKYGSHGAFAELARIRIAALTNAKGSPTPGSKAAKVSLFGIEIPISTRMGVAGLLVAFLLAAWWNWPAVCDRVGICGKRLTLSSLREDLHARGPSETRLRQIIAMFDFNDRRDTSLEEAKLLMAFLGPHATTEEGRGAISGSFGEPREQARFEVTFWTNSYDQTNAYGVRYGLTDSRYWACNDSYFEVLKVGNGAVNFNRPDNFAPCAPEAR